MGAEPAVGLWGLRREVRGWRLRAGPGLVRREGISMKDKALPATISISKTGELLGISRRTAYRAAGRDQIPTIRIGRRIYVPTRPFIRMLGLEPADAIDLLDLDGQEVDGLEA